MDKRRWQCVFYCCYCRYILMLASVRVYTGRLHELRKQLPKDLHHTAFCSTKLKVFHFTFDGNSRRVQYTCNLWNHCKLEQIGFRIQDLLATSDGSAEATARDVRTGTDVTISALGLAAMTAVV